MAAKKVGAPLTDRLSRNKIACISFVLIFGVHNVVERLMFVFFKFVARLSFFLFLHESQKWQKAYVRNLSMLHRTVFSINFKTRLSNSTNKIGLLFNL